METRFDKGLPHPISPKKKPTPMTDKSVEQQIAKIICPWSENPKVCESCATFGPCPPKMKQGIFGETQAILSMERNGIPLKRVVELWEQGKLAQIQDNQTIKGHVVMSKGFRMTNDAAAGWNECARHHREAGFKRVTEARGEG